MKKTKNQKRSFRFGHGLVALSAVFAGGTLAGCGGGGGGGGGGSASTTAPITTAGQNGVEVDAIALANVGSGALTSVQVENDLAAGFQLLVDGTYSDANGATMLVDVTRDAVYTVDDDTVCEVTKQGLIQPKSPGAAKVTIKYTSKAGKESTSSLAVQITAPTGTTPNFTSLAVLPGARTLAWVDPAAGAEQLQQIVVYAVDDQGVTHDLTRSAGVTLQDDQGNKTVLGSVDQNGLFRGVDNGKVWAVGRLQAAGLVAGAELVLGTGVAKPVDPNQLYSGAPLAGSQNELDKAVLDNLFRQFIEPAALSSDGEFIRRLYADAIGRSPTETEVDAFLADKAADKREKEVDKLLSSPDFATRWGGLMSEWFEMANGAPAFATWAEGQISSGATMSAIYGELAKGNQAEFEARHDTATKKAGVLMATGTGMTAKCGECHDHPLVGPNDPIKWVQSDFYKLVAFFAANATEATALDGRTNTRVGQPQEPGFPGAAVSTKLADPLMARRAEFASVLPASALFRRGMAHRIFAEVTSPLLNPDQFLQKNLDAVTVPNVLAAIEKVFSDENTSLQGFLRQVFTSKWYQLSSDATNMDTQYDGLLQRHMIRRHHAEFVIDALESATGMAPNAAGLTFLQETWGFPATKESISERSDAVNMSQALVLQNSPFVQDRINGAKISAIAADVDSAKITAAAAVTKLFRSILSRDPSAAEITEATDAIGTAGSTAEGLQDVATALFATIEFSMR
ncbi:MAG: DUF1549 domain-containing protein [Planctomycetota bacterium]